MDDLAVITGGSTGIGWCLVKAFAAAGHAVTSSYISTDAEAASLVQEVEGDGKEPLE